MAFVLPLLEHRHRLGVFVPEVDANIRAGRGLSEGGI
jgi:hypothetical protein